MEQKQKFTQTLEKVKKSENTNKGCEQIISWSTNYGNFTLLRVYKYKQKISSVEESHGGGIKFEVELPLYILWAKWINFIRLEKHTFDLKI